ncbi:MAG: NAD-dependent epimerase/dehydratase family protein [Verrucomicrobia bacterium]|nr:NAD-dependent epimerase/dehydratase family protein [Verrucomicrobiota bacterium]
MISTVLITGGAGFIGSHLTDHLLARGYKVRILDVLVPQVHGENRRHPAYLAPEAEFIYGDIRDPEAVKRALKGVDAVFHLAATVGVGQSMYKIHLYSDVNALGTAVLLEALADHPVERLVVASSMSVYGEGLYKNSTGQTVENAARSLVRLRSHEWDLYGDDEEKLLPFATPETKVPSLPSVYALSKYYQERLCLNVAQAYGIPSVALRFFNVFGTRQSLSNPYTGVLAIFASRLLNNRPPMIHEDGLQRRDFVYIKDLVQACGLTLSFEECSGQVFNVGSGQASTILEVAEKLAKALDKPTIQPQIADTYRTGDIRNCFADITRAREILGYHPVYSLEQGLTELVEWLSTQSAEDHSSVAARELAERGLTV